MCAGENLPIPEYITVLHPDLVILDEEDHHSEDHQQIEDKHHLGEGLPLPAENQL